MLGSANVLCVDKTGTLTLNQMEVRRIFAHDNLHSVICPGTTLQESLHETVEFAILASQTDPFDPMERALRETGVQAPQ